MTTELEKKFFETFGIEPIPNGKSCIMCCHREYDLISLIGSCTLKTTYDKCDFAEKYYPQITDRHYLELERICGEIVWYMGDSLIYEIDKKENKAVDFRHKYYAKEYSDRICITGLTKKEALLKLCINSYIKEKIKHQVQELFKGE